MQVSLNQGGLTSLR